MKVSRILHAGYVFESDGVQIAFDPIFENPFSKNCYAFPNVRFDHEQIRKIHFAAVFISHFHDDHCSLESLQFLDRQTPIYIFCLFDELIEMIQELGFTQVQQLDLNVPIHVGPFEVTPRRALDADVDSIFHVKAEGLNVLNVVDSWIDPETLELLGRTAVWDLVLWPFQTMRELEVIAPSRALPAPAELPPEWKQQLQFLNPRFVVPSSCQFVQESWSWYNHAFFPISYRQFQKEIEDILPTTKVLRLNPSVVLSLDKNSVLPSTPLSWIQPIGEQDVDYDYRPELVPPPTSEIAQRFLPLTAEQAHRVYEYCRVGLLQKFCSLEPSEEPYFQQRRLWRLSVYDDKGRAEIFYYLLEADHIERATGDEQPLAWCTDIPLAKFYAGLELGESLTSMYLRINDVVFIPEIENVIQTVDIVEDPLIRCLFSGSFGAYQKAQLRKLS